MTPQEKLQTYFEKIVVDLDAAVSAPVKATIYAINEGRRLLALEDFGAMAPSLGHAAPRRLARGIAGELCHLLAIGGVSQELFGGIDGRRMHAAFLLADGQAGADPFCMRRLRAKAFGVIGQPQPAQRQFAPGRPLLQIARSLHQLQALTRTLLICIEKDHRLA